ncbi:MAG: class I SAM-dependent methyltransferase [Candidatus Aminicenantales bacterium]
MSLRSTRRLAHDGNSGGSTTPEGYSGEEKNNMGKRESRDKGNLHFWLMALSYKLRDLLAPRKNILKEVGLKEGALVLDFGCGPGSYLPPLAKIVGPSGKIYALDVHPLAIQMVKRLVARKRLTTGGLFRLVRKGKKTYSFTTNP